AHSWPRSHIVVFARQVFGVLGLVIFRTTSSSESTFLSWPFVEWQLSQCFLNRFLPLAKRALLLGLPGYFGALKLPRYLPSASMSFSGGKSAQLARQAATSIGVFVA